MSPQPLTPQIERQLAFDRSKGLGGVREAGDTGEARRETP